MQNYKDSYLGISNVQSPVNAETINPRVVSPGIISLEADPNHDQFMIEPVMLSSVNNTPKIEPPFTSVEVNTSDSRVSKISCLPQEVDAYMPQSAEFANVRLLADIDDVKQVEGVAEIPKLDATGLPQIIGSSRVQPLGVTSLPQVADITDNPLLEIVTDVPQITETTHILQSSDDSGMPQVAEIINASMLAGITNVPQIAGVASDSASKLGITNTPQMKSTLGKLQLGDTSVSSGINSVSQLQGVTSVPQMAKNTDHVNSNHLSDVSKLAEHNEKEKDPKRVFHRKKRKRSRKGGSNSRFFYMEKIRKLSVTDTDVNVSKALKPVTAYGPSYRTRSRTDKHKKQESNAIATESETGNSTNNTISKKIDEIIAKNASLLLSSVPKFPNKNKDNPSGAIGEQNTPFLKPFVKSSLEPKNFNSNNEESCVRYSKQNIIFVNSKDKGQRITEKTVGNLVKKEMDISDIKCEKVTNIKCEKVTNNVPVKIHVIKISKNSDIGTRNQNMTSLLSTDKLHEGMKLKVAVKLSVDQEGDKKCMQGQSQIFPVVKDPNITDVSVPVGQSSGVTTGQSSSSSVYIDESSSIINENGYNGRANDKLSDQSCIAGPNANECGHFAASDQSDIADQNMNVIPEGQGSNVMHTNEYGSFIITTNDDTADSELISESKVQRSDVQENEYDSPIITNQNALTDDTIMSSEFKGQGSDTIMSSEFKGQGSDTFMSSEFKGQGSNFMDEKECGQSLKNAEIVHKETVVNKPHGKLMSTIETQTPYDLDEDDVSMNLECDSDGDNVVCSEINQIEDIDSSIQREYSIFKKKTNVSNDKRLNSDSGNAIFKKKTNVSNDKRLNSDSGNAIFKKKTNVSNDKRLNSDSGNEMTRDHPYAKETCIRIQDEEKSTNIVFISQTEAEKMLKEELDCRKQGQESFSSGVQIFPKGTLIIGILKSNDWLVGTRKEVQLQSRINSEKNDATNQSKRTKEEKGRKRKYKKRKKKGNAISRNKDMESVNQNKDESLNHQKLTDTEEKKEKVQELKNQKNFNKSMKEDNEKQQAENINRKDEEANTARDEKDEVEMVQESENGRANNNQVYGLRKRRRVSFAQFLPSDSSSDDEDEYSSTSYEDARESDENKTDSDESCAEEKSDMESEDDDQDDVVENSDDNDERILDDDHVVNSGDEDMQITEDKETLKKISKPKKKTEGRQAFDKLTTDLDFDIEEDKSEWKQTRKKTKNNTHDDELEKNEQKKVKKKKIENDDDDDDDPDFDIEKEMSEWKEARKKTKIREDNDYDNDNNDDYEQEESDDESSEKSDDDSAARTCIKKEKSKILRKLKPTWINVKLEDHPDMYEMNTFVSLAKRDKNVEMEQKSYERFACKKCGFSTTDKLIMESHIQLHLQGKLTCSECKQEFSTIKLLIYHCRSEHQMEKYLCSYCGAAYFDLTGYKRHMAKTHNEYIYKCDFCDEKFVTTKILKEHGLQNHPDKYFKCNICERIYKGEKVLQRHLELADCKPVNSNPEEERATCEHCGKGFANASKLKAHIRRVHQKIHLFKCDKCPYSTGKKALYEEHLMTHTGVHPHQCEFCDFSCIKSFQLTCHMRTHTGDKPYKCDQCKYASAWNVQLKEHKKAHISPARVECTLCQIMYRDQKRLNLHQKKEHKDQKSQNLHQEKEHKDKND